MKKRKCIIWDLDNTLWDGVCLEGDVRVRQEVEEALGELDSRGIIHSIASRGVEKIAIGVLNKYSLDCFFVFPRINWLPKPTNIMAISRDLNISIDSIAFVDDDRFELEQASYMLPELLTIEAHKTSELLLMPEFMAGESTSESQSRRIFYQAEEKRRLEELRYPSRDEFLKSCEIRSKVRPMTNEDVPRVLELMSRTHQLNTTGRIIPTEELHEIFRGLARGRKVLVSELTDRFGSYGIIGAAILQESGDSVVIEYLSISCRVLGRGVERALVSYFAGQAREEGASLIHALFSDTGKNREMRALFQIMGFRSSGQSEDGLLFLTADSCEVAAPPSWIEVL
jgi:FkbH-like protein